MDAILVVAMAVKIYCMMDHGDLVALKAEEIVDMMTSVKLDMVVVMAPALLVKEALVLLLIVENPVNWVVDHLIKIQVEKVQD